MDSSAPTTPSTSELPEIETTIPDFVVEVTASVNETNEDDDEQQQQDTEQKEKSSDENTSEYLLSVTASDEQVIPLRKRLNVERRKSYRRRGPVTAKKDVSETIDLVDKLQQEESISTITHEGIEKQIETKRLMRKELGLEEHEASESGHKKLSALASQVRTGLAFDPSKVSLRPHHQRSVSSDMSNASRPAPFGIDIGELKKRQTVTKSTSPDTRSVPTPDPEMLQQKVTLRKTESSVKTNTPSSPQNKTSDFRSALKATSVSTSSAKVEEKKVESVDFRSALKKSNVTSTDVSSKFPEKSTTTSKVEEVKVDFRAHLKKSSSAVEKKIDVVEKEKLQTKSEPQQIDFRSALKKSSTASAALKSDGDSDKRLTVDKITIPQELDVEIKEVVEIETPSDSVEVFSSSPKAEENEKDTTDATTTEEPDNTVPEEKSPQKEEALELKTEEPKKAASSPKQVDFRANLKKTSVTEEQPEDEAVNEAEDLSEDTDNQAVSRQRRSSSMYTRGKLEERDKATQQVDFRATLRKTTPNERSGSPSNSADSKITTDGPKQVDFRNVLKKRSN